MENVRKKYIDLWLIQSITPQVAHLLPLMCDVNFKIVVIVSKKHGQELLIKRVHDKSIIGNIS